MAAFVILNSRFLQGRDEMLNRLRFLAVCTIAMPLMASAIRAAEGTAETQVRVNITLYDESAAEAGRKILAEPDIVVMLGRPFKILVGGELGGKSGNDGLEYGTGVRGKIERQGPETLLVRISLALRHAVRIEDAPEIQLVRTETLDVRAPTTIGKVTRIPCGELQTLEIELLRLSADEPNARPESSKTSPADG